MNDRATLARAPEASPYVGLASFTESDRCRFFGRDAESEALDELVCRERLVVVYGLSGLGKSSLLQAGLAPRLRERDYLPVYIRLAHGPHAPPLAAQVRQRLAAEIAAHGLDGRPPANKENLWEYFHRVALWSPRNRLVTVVLVLDQFEEAFAQGTDRNALRALAAMLGDFATERIPCLQRSIFDPLQR